MSIDDEPGQGIGPPRSLEELKRRIEDAALTLRRMPLSRSTHGPAGYRSNWPDYVRAAAEAYGYQVTQAPKVRPTLAEIGRMEEALGWVWRWWSPVELERAGLPRDAGQVAWALATRTRMRAVQESRWQRWGMRPGGAQTPPGGCSPPALRALSTRALGHMLRGLGVDPQRVEAQEVAAGVAAGGPAAALDVVVDRVVVERFARLGGAAVPVTSHARARHSVVVRGRSRGED